MCLPWRSRAKALPRQGIAAADTCVRRQVAFWLIEKVRGCHPFLMPDSQSLHALYCKKKQNRPLMAAPFDKVSIKVILLYMSS
jgi:hypothetical protein